MDIFSLNILSSNIGGYFSSEQLELLSIIQCSTHEELISFIYECAQLNGMFSKENLHNFITQDLEQLKRYIFKSYQDTLVLHNTDRETILDNTFQCLGIKQEDIDVIKRIYNEKNIKTIEYVKTYIKNKYPTTYEDIFRQAHRFISTERNQHKDSNLYDKFIMVNDRLSTFNTLLVGSGKLEKIINEFFDDKDRFDFYFATRDLEFARRNNKHIRFHSLLTKGANETLFNGRSKEEIFKLLTVYVKTTIDFVNEYNSTYKLADGTPVINSIDLFNEIVSFSKNAQGEYENIWEAKYGISIQDICNIFAYAKEHKPEGVSYLYNEPFLEDAERRKKVIQVLHTINSLSNGLIDTLGSQMHITFKISNQQIQDCFSDFKMLQNTQNMNIQITEFDLSLSERETLKTIGDNPQVSYEQVYKMKRERINTISTIINNSGVKLNGITYWSLTDNIDCNLERIRTNLLNKGIIFDISQIPTVCGGLIPTSQQYINIIKNNASLIDNSGNLKVK